MQLDNGKRGFSFLRDGGLDMRMGPVGVTAEEIVNKWSEKKLGEIFREYGEVSGWRQVAKAIVEARKKKKIQSTKALVEVVKAFTKTRKRLHPATLVFQALRMAVNQELYSIKKGVQEALGVLKPGGRIGVISFHRLEHRLVKALMKETPKIEMITKKSLAPTRLEIGKNPRARSGRLRCAKKSEGSV